MNHLSFAERQNKYYLFFFLCCIVMQMSCTNTSPDSSVSSNSITPPNIVLILTDDQGWGDLSMNGNTNLSTPNVDRIAAEGATFEHFYVCPVCSPTRAEILTGRYHQRSGVYSTSAGGERMDLDEITIAQLFQKAGYKTAAYGKWHNGMQPPYHPNARGFDEYYGFCSGHWGHYFSPMLEHNGAIVKGNGFVIDDFTEQAMSFMEAHQEDPFFVYLPYNTPHSPMQVPDRWWNNFKDKELSMLHREPEKEDHNFTRAALAMVENIDWNVGRILKKLEALNVDENTIVLFLSDNGPNSARWNAGMRGRKGSTDEGGVRSPLVMRWPGEVAAGKKITPIAGAIDLLPTLADLAGIEISGEQLALDGQSLKPLLLDGSTNWEDRVLLNAWKDRVSVRNQKYRLDNNDQLYDIEKDLAQANNIAEQQPEVYQQLKAAKAQYVSTVLSELPKLDERTFPIGHPDYKYTQVPARDALWEGGIKRSNRWPNCSFLSNWTSTDDRIYWPSEVLAEGVFEVDLYYTCAKENVGSTVELRFNNANLKTKITEAHDPPLVGREEDRHQRGESYVKDFKVLPMGRIALKKGRGTLQLQAVEIPGEAAIDFRLLMFKRVE